ncbi:hypothetical protein LTR53_020028, partial [Teratosphaeriaceae sp. CCFEE 6253]
MARVWAAGLANSSAMISAPDAAGKDVPKTPSQAGRDKSVDIALAAFAVGLLLWTV